ncbi:MAG: cupin domain-containing protein [Chloroflexi bacterium]|nr:cupin domain-containing protein [Chloroflexota bacterium]
MKWFAGNADDLKKFSSEQLVNLNLFDGEAFFGRLLCFSKGQVVPYHRHEHKDECFDVVAGEGTFLIDGREMGGPAGMTLYVPANVEHGLRADGSEEWIVRETAHERIYAGRAAKMVIRAALRRLPVVGARLRIG